MSEPFDFHVDFHGVKKATPDDWKENETQWKQAFQGLTALQAYWEKQKLLAEEMGKEINAYLERKCDEYRAKNNLPFTEWMDGARSIQVNEKWEVYFKDKLVCGVRIASMTSEQTGEFSITLKSAVEFY